MAKGTPSMGKKNKKTHIRCRRCGRNTYHIRKKVCASCGFGKSKKNQKIQLAKQKTYNQTKISIKSLFKTFFLFFNILHYF